MSFSYIALSSSTIPSSPIAMASSPIAIRNLTRWGMNELEKLLRRMQLFEERKDAARKMFQRGQRFWKLGEIWKRVRRFKVKGEIMQSGGVCMRRNAIRKNDRVKDKERNVKSDLKFLSEQFRGWEIRICSGDDVKIAMMVNLQYGWTGSIAIERPVTEEIAENLSLFGLV